MYYSRVSRMKGEVKYFTLVKEGHLYVIRYSFVEVHDKLYAAEPSTKLKNSEYKPPVGFVF